MIVVDLFSGGECGLCDDAREILKSVQRDIPFQLREILLLPDNPHYEEYRDHIPVIHVNGSRSFRHRIPEESFRKQLLALTAKEHTRS